MSDYVKIPPIGLEPLCVHQAKRLMDIKQAINRFIDARVIIPIEWITEYNNLIKTLENKE